MEEAGELLLKLLRVYTPSGEEARLHPILRKEAERLGYWESYVDEAGNFVACYGKGAKTILLAGHVDTVPGELEVGSDGVSIWGRGAVDAKGALTALLLGGSQAMERLRGVKVYVVGLAREETDSAGAYYLRSLGFKADHILVGEPTGLGIAVAYRGSLFIQALARARGGHSSAPYLGESALDKLLDFLQDVRSRFSGRSYEEPTSALTVLRAGDWPGSLPEFAEAHLNIRFPAPLSPKEVLGEVERLAASHGVELEVKGVDAPVEVSVNVPVVRALTRGLIRTGVKPRLVKKTGTSDMNILYSLTRSIAAFGPGDSRLAHTHDERIKIDDVMKAVRAVAEALIELSRIG